MISVATPLGDLQTGLAVGEGRFLPGVPMSPDFGSPMVFEDHGLRVQCLIEPARPELPDGMHVSGGCRVKWTIVAVASSGPITVSWTWADGYQWTDGGASGGQYFDGMTYTSDGHTATIGTRDGDWLAHAAAEGSHVPQRFEEEIDPEFYMLNWVRYRTEGLVIDVPALEKGERVEVFLSAAWRDREPGGGPDGDDDSDASTWFAADLSLLW